MVTKFPIWRRVPNHHIQTPAQRENMAKYLQRRCPKCGGHLGIVLREPSHRTRSSDQRPLFLVRLSARLDTRARQTVSPTVRHCSPFIELVFPLLRPGTKRRLANAPRWHYSRLYRASVFIPVVAQPIQDISTVSITDQTVAIGLPRLWCGAIEWRIRSR
jgi:hypothetical protein